MAYEEQNQMRAEMAYAGMTGKAAMLDVSDEGKRLAEIIQYYNGCMIASTEAVFDKDENLVIDELGRRHWRIKVVKVDLKAKGKDNKDLFNEFDLGRALKRKLNEEG